MRMLTTGTTSSLQMVTRFHPPYISPSDNGTTCFEATRRRLGYLERSLRNEKMVVKVYGKAQAVCPQRVMHCLVEKGVPFELVHVDIDTMEHKRPEFLQKQVALPLPFFPLCVVLDFFDPVSFLSHSGRSPTSLTETWSSSVNTFSLTSCG